MLLYYLLYSKIEFSKFQTELIDKWEIPLKLVMVGSVEVPVLICYQPWNTIYPIESAKCKQERGKKGQQEQ